MLREEGEEQPQLDAIEKVTVEVALVGMNSGPASVGASLLGPPKHRHEHDWISRTWVLEREVLGDLQQQKRVTTRATHQKHSHQYLLQPFPPRPAGAARTENNCRMVQSRLGLGFRVLGIGLRVEGLGLRVEGLRVWGLGFRVQGLGFRV